MCKAWPLIDDDGAVAAVGPHNKFLLGMSEVDGQKLYDRLLHLCNWTDDMLAESRRRGCFKFTWEELDSCLTLLSHGGLSYGTGHSAYPMHFNSHEELALKLSIRGVF